MNKQSLLLMLGLCCALLLISTSSVARPGFQKYQPNYFSYQSTSNDDDSFEVHYSLRYMIDEGPVMKPFGAAFLWFDDYEAFVSYTGEFDFYFDGFGTGRESGPVINRVSNPAGHIRLKRRLTSLWGGFTFSWLNIGLEHRSDGQVVDVDKTVDDPASSDHGRYYTQLAYENGDYQYFDALSRGADYFSFEVSTHWGKGSQDLKLCETTLLCVDLWLSAKYYIGHDTNITWGPLANSNTSIWDYDVVRAVIVDRVKLNYTYLSTVEFGAEFTLGTQLLDTASANYHAMFEIAYKNFSLPLFLRWHRGPMDTLSDYTATRNSFGIGLKFFSECDCLN